MPMASKRRSFFATTFYSLLLSVIVEISQLFMQVGSFVVDDLLLNTIGGMLGFIAFAVCNVIRRNYAKKTK